MGGGYLYSITIFLPTPRGLYSRLALMHTCIWVKGRKSNTVAIRHVLEQNKPIA